MQAFGAAGVGSRKKQGAMYGLDRGDGGRRRVGMAIVLALTLAVGSVGGPARAQSVEIVRGEVTPLALDRSSGSVLRFASNIAGVFVANPEIADVMVMSDRLLYVYGRTPGRTDVVVTDGSDNLLGTINLTVRLQMGDLNTALRQADPTGSIAVTTSGNDVVLDGTVSDPAAAARVEDLATAAVGAGGQVINRTTLGGSNQVTLRVRVAEVERSVIQRLGINWNSITNIGNFTFGLLTDPTSVLNAVGAGAATARGQYSAPFDLGSDISGNIDVVLEALEQEGAVTTLAEPNLTAISGETASFLAGGSIPIPVPDDDGIGIEYRDFGVSLTFSPQVLSEERISLYVRPEVSSLNDARGVTIAGTQVPGFTTRRAETTVELASGQTFAIAGLFERQMTTTRDNLPLLADLPVLGPLFRSQRFERNESELVILITPYRVRPMTPDQVVTPLDPPDRVQDAMPGPPPTARLDTAQPNLPGTAQMTGFILK